MRILLDYANWQQNMQLISDLVYLPEVIWLFVSICCDNSLFNLYFIMMWTVANAFHDGWKNCAVQNEF